MVSFNFLDWPSLVGTARVLRFSDKRVADRYLIPLRLSNVGRKSALRTSTIRTSFLVKERRLLSRSLRRMNHARCLNAPKPFG